MCISIDVFAGAVTDVEARVYARCRDSAEGERIVLGGLLRGPFCQHSRTLVAEIALRDLGPGPAALAEALVPDPCTWTPDLPHWYEIEVEARRGGSLVGAHRAMFGIRRFAARGASFELDGRRWVIRGARQEGVIESPLSEWRDARMAMLAVNPSEALCEAASREGVMLLAEVSRESGAESAVEEVNRLAQWPAVGVVVLPESATRSLDPLSGEPKRLSQNRPRRGVQAHFAPQTPQSEPVPGSSGIGTKNIVVAQRTKVDDSQRPATRIDAVMCDAIDAAGVLGRIVTKPIIVAEYPNDAVTPMGARQRCENLQRKLTMVGDFAGFLV